MNKILLNILIFVGSQQFILGTKNNIILGPEVNKEIEPKLGVCLSCYVTLGCDHDIHGTYTTDDPNNCPICVHKVYPVCYLKHTMCADCIYEFVFKGVNSNGGKIECVFFNQKEPVGGKNFEPCKDLIDKKVVIQIFDILEMEKKVKEDLLKRYIEMQNNLQNDILFLEPQNERCKYEECTGYFDVTKGFICNKDKRHEHCGNCFDKIHEGECKNPLEEYKFYVQQNEEIQKKIKNKQLKDGDIEGYKPCPNCHTIIAKGGGCNHITCGKHWHGSNDWHGIGCGYQWCWRCGKACFCDPDDKGEPGNDHYDDKNSSCCGKHMVRSDKNNQNYFDDGDYFGIKNGKFKKQFEKLAKDMLIGVEVETPNKYLDIKKKDWESIINARKKYQKEHPENHYPEIHYAVDDSKNCCTECCGYVFTFFQ